MGLLGLFKGKEVVKKEYAPGLFQRISGQYGMSDSPRLDHNNIDKAIGRYADQAWIDYNEALELQPRKTLEERYGGKRPEAYVAFAGNKRPLSEPTPVGEATPASFSHTAIEASK